MSDDTQARKFIESQGVKKFARDLMRQAIESDITLKKPIRTLREYAEHVRSQKLKPRKKSRRRGMDPDNPLEHVEQATLFKWKFLYLKQIPELEDLFGIGNQGAGRLKNLQTEGTLRGVSDCFLAVPRDRREGNHLQFYCGLWIEMKRVKHSKVSPEQMRFLARMKARGYETAIAHGAEEAWEAILKYLQVKDPRR